MNTVSLAKDPFIRKDEGGGGGATINNQEKSLEITENGTTEVKPDAGFTGLSKVIVNTNVQSGGGAGSDMPVIGDGKTYLYITIAAEGRMNVPLCFQQSVANGVTIDWGDGSAPQTVSGTGDKSATHKYAAIGDYVISLAPAEGCTLGLGAGSSMDCVMGDTKGSGRAYCKMLKYVEIGKNVTSIGNYAFAYCCSLASVVIPNGVTSIGNYAFDYCYALKSIAIPNSITSIGNYAFAYCCSLASVVIPNGVTSISNYLFNYCYGLVSIVFSHGITSIGDYSFRDCNGMAFYDFSQCEVVPSLGSQLSSFLPSDCKIIVPDANYDEWKASTNWSAFASKIIKKSDWDAQS